MILRRVGLMVSALDSGLSGLGSSPGRGHCVTRHFTLIVPLSTQVYKWEPVNLMLGYPCDGLASNPVGSRNTVLL